MRSSWIRKRADRTARYIRWPRLTDEHIAELEEETSKLLNVKVKLKNEIDPGLIGGFKILAEGKIIDASIRRKFDDLISQIS